MFYGGRWFIRALALSATKKPVLGKGRDALEDSSRAWELQDPEEGGVPVQEPLCSGWGKSGAELEQSSPGALPTCAGR